MESTMGSLYAYGRSLYLTLTEYRYRTDRAETINTANRRIFNPTGLANRTVHFVPESVKCPNSYQTAPQPPTPAKGEPTQQDTDLDALRKELQDLKKKLAEQETERTRSTPSSSPKPTPRSIP